MRRHNTSTACFLVESLDEYHNQNSKQTHVDLIDTRKTLAIKLRLLSRPYLLLCRATILLPGRVPAAGLSNGSAPSSRRFGTSPTSSRARNH